MTGEISQRVGRWLPDDVTGEGEIRQALEGSGFSDHWDDRVTDAVADTVASQRDPNLPQQRREARRQTTVYGPQDRRQTGIRAADGTILGDPENVKTWTDTHGNVMGHNSETGVRKKVTDSEERDGT